MKQWWLNTSARIDALNLRERALVFAAGVALVIMAIYHFALQPALAKQQNLTAEIVAKQKEILTVSNDINAIMAGQGADPDVALRGQLAQHRAEINAMSGQLRTMQNGMVNPERIASLLQSMLRANGGLKLVALKTLPVTGLSEQIPGLRVEVPAAPEEVAPANPLGQIMPTAMIGAALEKARAAAADAEKEARRNGELVFRHGVEITVQGNYMDMLAYMGALESMPVQLFWGRASLDASEFGKARLTLTVFTLSFEQKWMKL